MKIVSAQESEEWLTAHLGRAVTRDNLRQTVDSEYAHRVTYRQPAEAAKMTVLARAVVRHIVDTRETGMLWFTDWGIFPSLENMAIFDGYRRSLGENRPLISAPGHIFSQTDLTELECLLALAFYFSWDASLFDGTGTIVFRTSHDEWISVHAKNEQCLTRFENTLQRLKLTPLT